MEKIEQQETGVKNRSNGSMVLAIARGVAMSSLLLLGDGRASKKEVPKPILVLSTKPVIIQDIERKYEISIIYNESLESGKIRYKKAEFSSQFFDMLDKTLSRFPREMIRESGVKNIYVVNTLYLHNATESHPASCVIPWCKNLENLFGLKSGDTDSIYIAQTKNEKEVLEWEMLDTLHHEFFHFFDSKFNVAKNYSEGKLQETSTDDPLWTKLNPKGFRYRGQDWKKHAKRYIKNGKNIPGLSSNFGLTSASEDQASNFENIISVGLSLSTLKLVKKDPIVRKKLEIITGCKFDPKTLRFSRTLTLEEYKKYGYKDYNYWTAWSHGEMDEKWWNTYLDELNNPRQ